MPENKSPTISVIVPVYNVERFVEQSIRSVLDQTFRDFELIVIDDASPDRSIEIVQRLAQSDARIKIIRHERNQGLGAARNTGLIYARGEYVFFLDSDDMIVRNALETLHRAAESSKSDVVHFTSHFQRRYLEDSGFDRALQVVGDRTPKHGLITSDRNIRIAELYTKFGSWMMVWRNFYRRDFFEHNRLQFPNMLSEDEPFFVALLCLADKFYCIPEPLYVYSERSDSISKSNSVERAARGITSMLEGCRYIERITSSLPKGMLSNEVKNHCLHEFMLRMIGSYVLRAYDGNTLVGEDAVDNFIRAVRPTFVENSELVADMLRSCAMLTLQAESMKSERRSIEQNFQTTLGDLIQRSELSARKIVLMNFFGKGFGCNPKAIANEILRRKLPYDLVWLVKDMNTPMPNGIRKVRLGSYQAEFELATANVIVTNIKNSPPFTKKPGQKLIMTWHGGVIYGMFKKIEREAEDQLSADYVAKSKLNSKLTDLMISGSKRSTQMIRDNWWYDGDILESGLPSNDVFFQRTPELVAEIKSRLGLPIDRKLMIYAPTFRDKPEDNLKNCRLDCRRLIQTLEKNFGGRWTILLRFHPNVASLGLAQSMLDGTDDIIDVTSYPDPQDLLVVADMMISDYSTVLVDMMLMRKPTFIFARDLDTYPTERGLKPLYFELPIDHNKTEDELIASIDRFDEQTARSTVDKFMNSIEIFDDGHASERVVDRIVDWIEPKELRAEPRSLVRDLYRDEVRSGFFVATQRKKLWNVQLELLGEVDRICRKHNLRYFADSGTLLGAARHRGFIPWDDAFTLVMLRPDYEKFKSVAPSELPSHYFLDLWYNYAFEGEPNPDNVPVVDSDYGFPRGCSFAKLRDNRTTRFNSSTVKRNVNNSICIDIFPFDPAPPFDKPEHDTKFEIARELLLAVRQPQALANALQNNVRLLINPDDLIQLLRQPFHRRALAYENYLAANYFEAEHVAWHECFIARRLKFKSSDFRGTIELPFENVTVSSPIGYEAVLTTYYGDWRTPVFDGAHGVDVYSSDVSYDEYFRTVTIADKRRVESDQTVNSLPQTPRHGSNDSDVDKLMSLLDPKLVAPQRNFMAAKYLRERYSDFLRAMPKFVGSGQTPKVFWWCWLQGEEQAPPLCRACLRALRRNYSDYQINVVTEKNIFDYVEFPPFIVDKYRSGKISRTHFSDLLRLELLIRHGGIWIDSTVFCTDREERYLSYPLFVFQSIWRNQSSDVASSWFIVAEKNNPILQTTRALLYRYWQDHDELVNYFVFHFMFKLATEKYPELWSAVPKFNNVSPHILQFEFFDQYSAERFDQIRSMSHFHKLTYPPRELSPEKSAGSFYEFVLDQ